MDSNRRGGRGRGGGGGGGEEDLGGVCVALIVVEGAAVVAPDRPRVRGHRPVVVRRHLPRGRDGDPSPAADHPGREDLRVLRRPPNPRHGARRRLAGTLACSCGSRAGLSCAGRRGTTDARRLGDDRWVSGEVGLRIGVSVRWDGTGVLGEGRWTVGAYSTEMLGHPRAGPRISRRVESVVRARLG